jgi:hypothetical protein
MKTAFRLSVLAMIIGVLSVAGCGADPPPLEKTVSFVSANPPVDSIIQQDTIITVTFNGVPGNVTVNPGKATLTGKTVTISDAFAEGAHSIYLSWDDCDYVLDYKVTPATQK